MSNIQTGAERMPHDLSHLGFLAGQIGRLITISTTPVIAGDSFEMDAVGALRLSPLRRGLGIDSTVDIFTFYLTNRHVYGEQWIKFMKDGVNATPLPTVHTTGYIDHAAFLGTINPDTNKIPKHLFQGYLNIYNNYFKATWMPDRCEANPNELNQDDARYGFFCQAEDGIRDLTVTGVQTCALPISWRRNLQRGQVGVQMLEAPHPQPAVRAAGGDLQRRITGFGVARLQSQRHTAVGDPDVPQQDERRRPVLARIRPAQAQQLLDVEAPARVLHDVDHGPAQVELEQHHPSRGEVERVVGHVGAGQPGNQRAVRVEQPYVRKRQAREQRAADVADLDRAREHLLQGAGRDAREQPPPRVRAHERGQRTQEGGERPREHPQRDPKRAADHQNAWPTANCTTTRRQHPSRD